MGVQKRHLVVYNHHVVVNVNYRGLGVIVQHVQYHVPMVNG
jgi:hypothetical protein